MTVILDAMGSDRHPEPEVLAAILFTREFKEELILVGNENEIKPLMEKNGGTGLQFELFMLQKY